MTDRLGHKQTAAMLALMALAREVPNPELEAVVGFTLVGREREQLNGLGLVASRKEGRPYVHELTDDGWAWCAGELAAGTPPPPSPRSTLVPALYLLLERVQGYLSRENVALASVLAPSVELTGEEIENRVRAAYDGLARSSGDWVALADLRPRLGGAPVADVDAVLKEMSRSGRAHLIPEANRKTLTPADHEAAIRIGGEDNHLLSIGAS